MKTLRLSLIAAFLLLVPSLPQASEPNRPAHEDEAYVQVDSRTDPSRDQSKHEIMSGNNGLERRRVISGSLNSYLMRDHQTSPTKREDYRPLNPIIIHW